MLGRILRALFNFVCGSDSAQAQQKPPQQQYPPSKPPTVPQLPGHYPTPHQQYPPPRPEHKPTKPSKPYGKYEDDNKINQANEYYRDLRARANEEGDKMAQCFQQGHEAYARGDGALAKEFSNKGKAHQKNMEALNKQASDWIFEANNRVGLIE
ncbi:hypothetical protein CC2G_008772 [Coprinopsis cinerea AmutBmut pab1-1]|nr:hypothetical protein CC2G_008772 [Coprinopsis cinerea AmutBmut pab1-1]